MEDMPIRHMATEGTNMITEEMERQELVISVRHSPAVLVWIVVADFGAKHCCRLRGTELTGSSLTILLVPATFL
jgi:hypothetical protein